jgi:hypothetical protein
MGMFDYVKCVYPLPKQEGVDLPEVEVFQTKDTPEQYMRTYVISEDGLLLLHLIQEEGEDPATKYNLVDFTGFIYFYEYLDGKTKGGWIEYEAKFFDGRLQTIKLMEYRPKED